MLYQRAAAKFIGLSRLCFLAFLMIGGGVSVWAQSVKKCRDTHTGTVAYVDVACPKGTEAWSSVPMVPPPTTDTVEVSRKTARSERKPVLQSQTVRLSASEQGQWDVVLEGRWFNPRPEPLVVLYRVWLQGADASQQKVVNRYWRLEPKTTTPMQDLLLKTGGPDGLGFTPQQVHMVYFTQDDPTEHWVNGITVQR